MSFFLYAIALLVIGAPALIAGAPKAFKDSLLAFDQSGKKMMLMGTTIVVAGLYVPDYTAAYTLTLSGIFVGLLGSWIALPDRITDWMLETDKGTIFFVLATAAIFVGGVIEGNSRLVYNSHGLANLVIPVGGTMFLIMATVLSALSSEFKSKMLSQDDAGAVLFWEGLVVLFITPFAGANPALMISATVLATGLMSLGFLVFMKDELSDWVLQPMFIPMYTLGVFFLLAWSRANF